jgi:ribonucleoside-diphosphate reductase alpha chain
VSEEDLRGDTMGTPVDEGIEFEDEEVASRQVTGQITTAKRTADDIRTNHLRIIAPKDTGHTGSGNGNGHGSRGGANGKPMENSSATSTDEKPQAGYESVATAESRPAANPVSDEAGRIQVQIRNARLRGYEGDMCTGCGSFTMVRNGTCLKCETCGETSGCS